MEYPKNLKLKPSELPQTKSKCHFRVMENGTKVANKTLPPLIYSKIRKRCKSKLPTVAACLWKSYMYPSAIIVGFIMRLLYHAFKFSI